jgi:hypothetical protein
MLDTTVIHPQMTIQMATRNRLMENDFAGVKASCVPLRLISAG